MRAIAIAALVVLVGLEGAPIGAAPAGSLPLPEDHERRLAAGEIIALDALPPGASSQAQGGTAVAVVRAPVEKVWGILTDYAGHPRFYPRVVSAEVMKASAGYALVRYVVAIGFLSFTFTMDKYQDPESHHIRWQLAPGYPNRLFRENSGYWQVDHRDGASLVTYGLAVRTVLPGFLTRTAERDSLIDTIAGLRRLAEAPESAGPR